MIHRKELERIRNILLERKSALENELRTLPEGILYCSRRKDWWVYYQLLPKKGNRKKEKRIGISRDTEKIFGLVRKAYIKKALGRIDKDIKVMEMALRHYTDIDEESVMAKFLEKHLELSDGIYHGRQRDEAWADDYERQQDFYAEKRKHTAADGTSMTLRRDLSSTGYLIDMKIPWRTRTWTEFLTSRSEGRATAR